MNRSELEALIEEALAVCVAAGHRQRIAMSDLPLPDPPPVGAEWVAAYRQWSGNA
ncbi:hypothetical protein L0U85_09455 [Glycomyces sp. L485]|uniref:hypothetical protein n=1 Tax=Glycomyces sp. L485 TaxID=2909235 RepID=UPI001F4A2757|nr:hypothetical protein [Glycomyces sp. L485]MCH7231076.1 hypothetical protein [Glycomyces sp. L485]